MPILKGFEPLVPSTLSENLVEIRRDVLKTDRPQTEKEQSQLKTIPSRKSFRTVKISVVNEIPVYRFSLH